MKFLILVLACLLTIQCSTSSQNQDKVSDSLTFNKDSVNKVELPIEPTADDNLKVFNPNDSLEQTVLLRWKEVTYSDYGPLYIFEDRHGKEVRVRLIEIPDWDFEHNDYTDTTYPAQNIYPVITIKEEVISKWYKVIMQMELRTLDGVEGVVPIIKSFEELASE